MEQLTDGTFALRIAGGRRAPAWIYVFDVNADSQISPNPIVLTNVIATDADSVGHYALRVAPEAALAVGGAADYSIRGTTNIGL